jgi:hypothetical protein
MTAFVQPRHIKLGLAGSERNWSYAAYELDQLRGTPPMVVDVPKLVTAYYTGVRDSSVQERRIAFEIRYRGSFFENTFNQWHWSS